METSEKKNNLSRIILLSIGAVLLVGFMVYKLLQNKEEVSGKIYIHDTEAAILVEASNPSNHTFEKALNFLGTFDPNKQNMIGSDAQGKIIRVYFEEGDRISTGQLIAKVDDELLQLQLQNAEIGIEGQKKDDERYDVLSKDKIIPGVQSEKIKLGIRSSEIQKKQLLKQIRNASIKAPFGGIVTKKMVEVGSVIGPGTPLLEITDISSLKLTVNVPERDILKFRLNQEVEVKADVYEDKSFSGKVVNIGVVADRSHNFKVQILVKNAKQELMAGMYGSVSLVNNQSKTALAIPRKALVGSSKNPQVYVIRNGKAILTSFNAGTSDANYIEVISGLNASDRVIVKGQVNVQNKSNVKTK